MPGSTKFAVLGAGAWGTAFAIHLAKKGQPVSLVPRRAEQAESLLSLRENKEYLPGIAIPQGVVITADLGSAIADTRVLLLACPSQALRDTCRKLINGTGEEYPRLAVSLAKGLELGSLLRPSEVVWSELPTYAAGSLTGPTNAAEVARGLPAAMVLAVAPSRQSAGDLYALLRDVQIALSGPSLRVYTSDDLTGVEIGGSLKNVYAIAAGCSDGLRLGDNTRAALLTRALAEMVRVGTALGARAETFYGLSGFGDLVATCHGRWSRNREFGFLVGEGRAVSELLSDRKSVVEGYRTTQAFHDLCEKRGIDAPILRETYAILFGRKAPAAAISSLMTRELKGE
jgi:glycerol-3-phosphate dehydrogenase (NAD(P)+)